MRRQDIRTGDMLAWSPYRDGRCFPGVALGPVPLYLKSGKYEVSKMGGAQYLLLVPQQDGQIQKIIESVADRGATEPGADFWGVGTYIRDFVYEAWEARADGIPTRGLPDGWRWNLIASPSIKGDYATCRAADVRRNSAFEAREAEKERGRQNNEERMSRTRARLALAELDPAQVSFVGWKPSAPEPDVRLPLRYLEMLLDDRER